MTTSVIVAGARTPIGKLMGSLKDFSGSDLGAIAIAGALEKAKVPASAVEYVIMGQVLTAGAGQMPARQAAVAAGIGWDVPSLSINKMCLSGIDAIALADQLIRAGEFDVVVAGGQESMTQAPHLLMNSRAGYKYGDVTVLDQHGLRRAARRLHRSADGCAHRAAQRRRQVHPRPAGRVRCAVAPAGRRGVEGRRLRRRGRARVDPAAQGRSASSSPRTRASAPTPPPNRWPGSSRRSARTAPSPRGRRRRSPTAHARSW